MYRYEDEKPKLLTDEGQRLFLKFRDDAIDVLGIAGAFRFDAISKRSHYVMDDWLRLACVDRMIELGELRDVTPPGTVGQHRIFISNRSK
jgi:hypothetical protein